MHKLLLLISLYLSLHGIAQDPDLTGVWECDEGRSRWELTIKENGKYKMDIYTDDVKEWFKGTWTIKKNDLILSTENTERYACYHINELSDGSGGLKLVPYLMFGEKRFVHKKNQTLRRSE